jgi:hypothetical protein
MSLLEAFSQLGAREIAGLQRAQVLQLRPAMRSCCVWLMSASLTVVTMLVVALGGTGCSDGKGLQTGTTGGTTSLTAGTTGTTGGARITSSAAPLTGKANTVNLLSATRQVMDLHLLVASPARASGHPTDPFVSRKQ